jgi:pimeloyl-ACP methyl ester carboxylesterase
MHSRFLPLLIVLFAVSLAGCSNDSGHEASAAPQLQACRLKGIEIELRCATIEVAEDRDAASPGRRIPIRFAVIPALARQPEADAIFVFAGGPGQAATDIAGQVYPLFAKLNRDRDIVFVDQRGTGGSHRLSCTRETSSERMSDAFDAADLDRRIAACAKRLGETADLTQYITSIAVRDFDDVRARLGYPRINLWGGSYGTRAALEYLRQFPDRVRTMTLDGVAPASLKLPVSFGVDTHAAVVGLVADCARDADCKARYPSLAADITALFAKLDGGPIEIDVTDPVSGKKEHVRLTRLGLASLLRTPLYISLTASLLPAAIEHATHGDYATLAALSVTAGSGLDESLAFGMHLSVLCSEDVQAISASDVDAVRAEAVKSTIDGRANPFATLYLDHYRRLCASWPTRRPPDGFYASLAGRPGADVPTLILSGGIDPATPPSRAAAIAQQLTHARHLIAPHVGHGVSLQGCAPDLIERFIKKDDATSLDGKCLETIPRPLFFATIVDARRDREAEAVP